MLFDFAATSPSELGVVAGEVVTVIHTAGEVGEERVEEVDGWYLAMDRLGRQGLLPATYVQKIQPGDNINPEEHLAYKQQPDDQDDHKHYGATRMLSPVEQPSPPDSPVKLRRALWDSDEWESEEEQHYEDVEDPDAQGIQYASIQKLKESSK